jgi:serine phosphatase RsbU (regulator of sigma subunit)
VPESDQPTNLAPARERARERSGPVPPTAITLDPELVARVGPPPGNTREAGRSPWEASLATGSPLIIDIAAGELRANSDDATNAWLARASAHNMAVLPLALAGRLAGAVVLMSFGDRAPYAEDDLPFLEQAAARAGTAVSHVRAFRQSRDIALDLQHALLPQAPGSLSGAEVAVRYVAGGPDVEVGGDWWDVHPLSPGRIGIGLGDVAGTGVQAAVVMGQARSAMRAAALAQLSPSAVLALLDEQLGGVFDATVGGASTPRFATALYAVLDTGRATLAVANAGHPPLLVRDVDGSTRWVQARPGPPLGLRLPTYEETVVPFAPGSLCLGFTDGLVESRRQGIQEGLDRLADLVGRLPSDADVEGVADAVLEQMAPGTERQDDIALVVLRSTA